MKEQTSIKISKTLAEEVDKLVEMIPGYLSRSEFIRDAIRLRIRQVTGQERVSDESTGRG